MLKPSVVQSEGNCCGCRDKALDVGLKKGHVCLYFRFSLYPTYTFIVIKARFLFQVSFVVYLIFSFASFSFFHLLSNSFSLSFSSLSFVALFESFSVLFPRLSLLIDY